MSLTHIRFTQYKNSIKIQHNTQKVLKIIQQAKNDLLAFSLAYKGVTICPTPLQASAKNHAFQPRFLTINQIQHYFWIHFGYISLIRGLEMQGNPLISEKTLESEVMQYNDNTIAIHCHFLIAQQGFSIVPNNRIQQSIGQQ
ncbi:Hypothetical_protein [Hexamita inflata]|uniref:Hypothetical_protein n=1 Tax=Hexamita inflata TaxID=28002 RepID=A0AA86QLA8_9EUKA|nr:Hypothetical protein HINF_LOCUS42879 [Hexamita inflata]